MVPLSPALPSLRAGFLPQVKVSYFESQQAAALAHSALYLTAVGESCSCLAVDTVAIGCGEGGRKLGSLRGVGSLSYPPHPSLGLLGISNISRTTETQPCSGPIESRNVVAVISIHNGFLVESHCRWVPRT